MGRCHRRTRKRKAGISIKIEVSHTFKPRTWETHTFHEFKASQVYTVSPCLKINLKIKGKKMMRMNEDK